MKYIFLSLLFFLLFSCTPDKYPVEIKSPSGNLKVILTSNEENKIFYQVNQITPEKESIVISSSPLGIKRSDADYTSNLRLLNAPEIKLISDSYVMISGKQKELSYSANEAVLDFVNEKDKKMQVIFRIFDEGLAFRYVFQGESNKKLVVESEITGFKVQENADAWMSIYQSATPWGNPAYEADYLSVKSGTPSPDKAGWAFPLLFNTEDNWIFISESGLDAGYCATHLKQECPGGLYSIAFPEADERLGDGEVNPASTSPWKMPWRFIIISDSLDRIIESSMVYHLAEPSKIKKTSWIIPGRASWSWWSTRGGRSVENLKRFVDLSVDMGWEYSLVDAGWGRMPDGTIEDVISYAKERDIGLLLWYSSGGRRDSTRRSEDFVLFNDDTRQEEFRKLAEWGVKGIKVDFFSTDKQYAITLYEKIMMDAAGYRLLVNFHGCTLPRGWTRTWPNLLTMEAVRGAECYRYAEEYPEIAPTFNTMAAVLRTTAGPTDYTPATFSNNRYPHQTTSAHELALTVVYESGIIHMADTPESYLLLPEEAREFLKKIPAAWDETRLIKAIPGELFVIARRKDNNWFVAGINGKNEKQEIQFSLPEPLTDAILIGDTESGSELIVSEIEKKPEPLRLTLMPFGGFVMY